MSGWDISSSGVEFVTSLVADAMDDVAKDVKAYGTDMESAAVSAGTVSGPYCGAAPTGALGARAAKSVNGAREATAYYLAGDLEMAGRSEHRALGAPKIDLPGQSGGQG